MNLQIQERDKTSDLLLGGVAAGIISYLLYKYLDPGIRTHTTPPIIIKSSPVLIESEQPLLDEPTLLKSSEDALAVLDSNSYSIAAFKAKVVRVFVFNEGGWSYVPIDFPNPAGVRVGIWLQYFQNNQWKWEGNPSNDPEILISGETADFKVKTHKKLADKEPNNHPVRKSKREYSKDKVWRFGKVKVYGFSDGEFITSLTNLEGNDYTLGFHNHIHA